MEIIEPKKKKSPFLEKKQLKPCDVVSDLKKKKKIFFIPLF